MAAFVITALLVITCREVSGFLFTAAVEKSQGQPWPMPQAYTSRTTSILIDSNISFTSNLASCDVISQAFDRYRAYVTQIECARAKGVRLFPDVPKENDESSLVLLNVDIKGTCEKWPTPTSDEQYSLVVNTPSTEGKAIIQAATIWGALRGLETFSQLVYDRGDGVLRINTTLILDSPRFTFRGLMLDTSRHFLPVPDILENIEAMAQNKFNVFHWHIVDDPSYPYVSKTFPKLSALGAFDRFHIYSPEDVAKVIEFARVRGIRVIPEFDTPGHALSWGSAIPGLLTPCYKKGRPDGTFGPVNPILNTTYTFFSTFFSELTTVFSDQYFHLGGDEVSFDCWKSNPDIQTFMSAHGMGQNYSLLQQYYEQNILNITKNLGKRHLIWQEVFDNQVSLDNSTIIHIWKDGYSKELSAVTRAGFNTILSSCWYLNYISYGIDWYKYYKCDPQNFNGTDAQKKLVIGGEACMWGEFVDGVNMMSSTWPRASVVAERLWSPATLTDTKSAAPRLEEHRCRMMKRGLAVQSVSGPGYCNCDIFY